jgi:hypothetical protein
MAYNKIGKSDNYDTPDAPLNLLYKYIPRDKCVWDPFFNTGQIRNYYIKNKIKFIHDDRDAFNYLPEYDILVSNPPFSIKKDCFKLALQLGKPFAYLVPLDTIERQYWTEMFKDKDFTLIIPKKRIKFTESNMTCPFKLIWITYGFNLNKQIIME